MRGDDIIGDAVRDEVGVILGGQKVQQVVIHGFQVDAVLPAIVQTAAGDLRELAGSREAFGGQGVRWGGVDGPVGVG